MSVSGSVRSAKTLQVERRWLIDRIPQAVVAICYQPKKREDVKKIALAGKEKELCIKVWEEINK